VLPLGAADAVIGQITAPETNKKPETTTVRMALFTDIMIPPAGLTALNSPFKANHLTGSEQGTVPIIRRYRRRRWKGLRARSAGRTPGNAETR
jgi:hypothetical protein